MVFQDTKGIPESWSPSGCWKIMIQMWHQMTTTRELWRMTFLFVYHGVDEALFWFCFLPPPKNASHNRDLYMFKFKTPEVPPIQWVCSRRYNPTFRGPITPCITHVRAHPWTYCSRYSEALYLDHPLRTVEEFNSREYFPYDFFLQRAPIWRKASSSSPGFIMGFRAGARGVFRGL